MRLWGRERVDREVPARSEQDIGVGESFDELAKSMADGTMPRRRALRLFGGALVGTAMASIPGVAWAKPCPPGELKCGKKCCPGDARCVRGKCVCPSGTTLCSGNNRCVEPVDPVNCEDPFRVNSVYNPQTCQCECTSQTTLCPGNNTCLFITECGTGSVYNPDTCRCTCLPIPGEQVAIRGGATRDICCQSTSGGQVLGGDICCYHEVEPGKLDPYCCPPGTLCGDPATQSCMPIPPPS